MPTASYRKSTHDYAGDGRFERSLDYYEPTKAVDAAAPLVVLVVGSAWLGHNPIIYAGTSWWNSSGPMTFAKLGIPCVAIRHRGAFPAAPPIAALLAILAASFYAPTQALCHVLLACAALGTVWHALSMGSASHDDMMDDVALALKWIDSNRARFSLTSAVTTTQRRPMVFGGYSSGAHVAMSLLQRPGKLAQNGLMAPTAGYDGILLLSGVCGARASPPLDAPAWAAPLVDALTAIIFGGREASTKLPSPVHTPHLTPSVPHLLIYCKHEAFGITVLESVLGILLCSTHYARALIARGVSVQQRPVDSDHWFVLGSKALSDAVQSTLLTEGWPFGAAKKE